jgi:hypothetical protein
VKSFVTLETRQCPVCGKEHETGALLLDCRLRETFEHFTSTGLAICTECKQDGYLAVIEAERIEGGVKTSGRVAWVREQAWSSLFQADPPACGFAWMDSTTFQSFADFAEEAG